jgi:hypothetical protein
MSPRVLKHHRTLSIRSKTGGWSIAGRRTAASGARLEHRARPAMRSAPGRLLHLRDLVLLGWLAEQYAARTDQLEVLLGCGPRSVQRVLARLRDGGLVSTHRVLVGQPAWVTPTRAGLRACGSQYKVWQPKLGVLLHTAAVNDVRLHIRGIRRGRQAGCTRMRPGSTGSTDTRRRREHEKRRDRNAGRVFAGGRAEDSEGCPGARFAGWCPARRAAVGERS